MNSVAGDRLRAWIGRAVAVILEMAQMLGDGVRRRAQRRLDALPETEQRQDQA